MFLLPLGHQYHLFSVCVHCFFPPSHVLLLNILRASSISSAHPPPGLYGFKKKIDSSQRNHLCIFYIQNNCLEPPHWHVSTSVPYLSFFLVLCIEASRNFWKAQVFLKNLCQTWFPFSSPSLLVMERFSHQLPGEKEKAIVYHTWSLACLIHEDWLCLANAKL